MISDPTTMRVMADKYGRLAEQQIVRKNATSIAPMPAFTPRWQCSKSLLSGA